MTLYEPSPTGGSSTERLFGAPPTTNQPNRGADVTDTAVKTQWIEVEVELHELLGWRDKYKGFMDLLGDKVDFDPDDGQCVVLEYAMVGAPRPDVATFHVKVVIGWFTPREASTYEVTVPVTVTVQANTQGYLSVTKVAFHQFGGLFSEAEEAEGVWDVGAEGWGHDNQGAIAQTATDFVKRQVSCLDDDSRD